MSEVKTWTILVSKKTGKPVIQSVLLVEVDAVEVVPLSALEAANRTIAMLREHKAQDSAELAATKAKLEECQEELEDAESWRETCETINKRLIAATTKLEATEAKLRAVEGLGEEMADAIRFMTMPITSAEPTVKGLLESFATDTERGLEALKKWEARSK